jgi:peptidoglycan/LPS O-acetylase OafA/YrhL
LAPAVSLYLDLVRLGAAVVVLLSHFAYTRFTAGEYLVFRRFGSDAVILFFVLSGYVIAYVTAERERGPGDYAVSRLARLYSVALPALCLTVAADQIGRVLDPSLYAGWWYKDQHPVWRFLVNAVFANELWFQSMRPFSNGPYWSLGYEFWYYALFGVWHFTTGRRRTVLITLLAAVIGPKVLLLLPVWLTGVWTYRYNRYRVLGPRLAWAFFFFPILAYAAIKYTGIDREMRSLTMALLGKHFVRSGLRWSDEFAISYVYAVLVAMNFMAVNSLSSVFERWLRPIARPIRYCAGLTFSIYLFHYPLLLFFSACYGREASGTVDQVLLLASTLIAIALLGAVTERKKEVARAWLSPLVRKAAGALAPRGGA